MHPKPQEEEIYIKVSNCFSKKVKKVYRFLLVSDLILQMKGRVRNEEVLTITPDKVCTAKS